MDEPKRFPRKTQAEVSLEEQDKLADKIDKDLKELAKDEPDNQLAKSVGEPEQRPGQDPPKIPTSENVAKPMPQPPNSEISEDELEDIEDAPFKEERVDRQALSLMGKAKLLATKRLVELLESPDKLNDLSATQILNIISQLEDLTLTQKWQRKLEKVILNNPSKLLPPNAGKDLLNKLKGHSERVKKAGIKDKREGANKDIEDMDIDLPD